jgi:hypothetical protein
MPEFAYSPQGTVTASQTSSLSRDVLVATTVTIDSNSRSPIAAFVNPNTPNTFPEALAIALDTNGNPFLTHLTRSTGGQGELPWISNPLGITSVSEVAAGTALLSFNPQPYGFYHDGSNLYYLQLNGTTWSPPAPIGAAITGLRVAYSPNGVLVLYGQAASGNLVICWQTGNGPFTSTEWTNLPVSSDVQVTLQDSSSGPNWQAASISGGALTVAQGSFPATPSPTGEAASVATPATTNGGQVVAGFWNAQMNGPAFIYVDGNGNLNSYCQKPMPIQQSVTVASATGFQQNANSLYANPSLHLYSVDTSGTLWVLHQDPNTPWNADNSPNFTSNLPLTKGIARVIGDMNPADAPTLFAVDNGALIPNAATLRLHFQDSATNSWRTDYMHVPPDQPESFEVTRYRSEIAVIDGNGIPVANCSLNLSIPPFESFPQSALDIAANGQTYYLTPAAPVTLSTTAHGKLTFAVLANSGLAIPQLTVTDNDGYGINLTINPSGPIHDYFAGTGTLNNNLPPFDSGGNTLSGATVNGESIITNSSNCGLAAQGLQTIGNYNPGSNSSNTSFLAMHFDMSDAAKPRIHTFTDRASLDAHLKGTPMAAFSLGSWLDSFAEDVWQGIEQAVTSVVQAVVTVADDVASIAITIGDAVVNFTLNTIEDIGHALGSLMMWVVDSIEDVIAWLKAIFDFGAIMATQAQFVSAIQFLIGDGNGNAGFIVNKIASQAAAANGWFKSQEATINGMFATMISAYQNSGINSLPGYAAPGAPSSSPVGSSGVAPSDCTNNVHNNFVQERVSSGASASSPGSNDGSLAQTWAVFESSLGTSYTDFENGLSQFFAGLGTIITDPSTAASAGIADLLTAAQDIIDALLELADAAVQGLCTMAEQVMTSLAQLLNTPIVSDFLQTIWSWIGGTGSLTILDILALLAAFPTTIIYTIATGSAPFPSESADFRSFAADASGGLPILAAIMQILYVIPAEVSLILGQGAPWWLTLLAVAVSALIFYFSGGTSAWSNAAWAGLGLIALNIVLVAPVAYFILQGLGAAQQQSTATALGDTAKGVMTVIGLTMLVFTIVAATSSDPAPSADQTASHVLLSLPQIFSCLQMSAFMNGPNAASAAVISGIVLGVGYIGGGSAELIGAA